MKSLMKLPAAITLGLLFLVVPTAPAAAIDVGEQRAHDGSGIHGAWKLSLIPEEGGPPPFDVLMMITRDGGIVETDAGPPDPQQFSPGIGGWIFKPNGGYSIHYSQIQFDAGQNHIGNFRARLEVRTDEENKTMSGTARVRLYDTDGNLLFEAFGTIEGARIELD